MPQDDFIEALRIHSLENLARALQEVEGPSLTLPRAVNLTEILVSHGHPKAARPINLLKEKVAHPQGQMVAKINERTVQRIRRCFRYEEVDPALLETFYRQEGLLYLGKKQRSSRLLVIFTTSLNSFYFSNAVMAALLAELDCELLFLRDPGQLCYLNGAKDIADDFPGIGDRIVEVARRHEIEKVYITGFSSAGYAALLTSLRIPCHGYLGFSQLVDGRSHASTLPRDLLPQVDPRWMVDLQPMLADADPSIPRALYYGLLNHRDASQGQHAEGLATIEAIAVPNTGHNTIQALFITDHLLGAFATLLGDRADWPLATTDEPLLRHE